MHSLVILSVAFFSLSSQGADHVVDRENERAVAKPVEGFETECPTPMEIQSDRVERFCQTEATVEKLEGKIPDLKKAFGELKPDRGKPEFRISNPSEIWIRSKDFTSIIAL